MHTRLLPIPVMHSNRNLFVPWSLQPDLRQNEISERRPASEGREHELWSFHTDLRQNETSERRPASEGREHESWSLHTDLRQNETSERRYAGEDESWSLHTGSAPSELRRECWSSCIDSPGAWSSHHPGMHDVEGMNQNHLKERILEDENIHLLDEVNNMLRLRSEDAKKLRQAIDERNQVYLKLHAIEDDRVIAAQDAQASIDRLRLDLEEERRRRILSDKRVTELERRLDELTDSAEYTKNHIHTAITALRHDRIHLVAKPLSPPLPHTRKRALAKAKQRMYAAEALENVSTSSVASTRATSENGSHVSEPIVSHLQEEIERTTKMLASALGYSRTFEDTQLV